VSVNSLASAPIRYK